MLITDAATLREHAERWAEKPWLTVDTEFIREDTYYAKLCLVQVGDGEHSHCIDALAVDDLTPLWALMHRPDILKVFHAAGQDLEIFLQRSGAVPSPLFDSQVAASLLGIGDQLGYAGLIDKLLGIKVDKTLSRTDWARRPLTAAELAYAADDVRHLAVIYPMLEAQLQQRGRLQWLREDCARMAEPARYLPKPTLEWQRLKGLARLQPQAQQVAAKLAEWRDRVGESRNRPRKWILSDEALYALAERRPQTQAQLEALGLPPKTLERHGATLLEQVAAGLTAPPVALARDERLSAEDKSRVQALLNRVKELATELGIPPSLLGPRADVEAVAFEGTAANVPLLRGWRREVAGEELLKLAGT